MYGTEIVQGVRLTFFFITPTHVHAHSQCTGVEIPPSCQLAGSVDSFKGSVYASHPFSPAALGISPKWQGIFIKSKRGKGGLGQMVEINSLSSTNARQMFPRTPLLCTRRSYSSRLNRRTDFSRSRILANEWNGECLLNCECILVRCLGHPSMHGASAPS